MKRLLRSTPCWRLAAGGTLLLATACTDTLPTPPTGTGEQARASVDGEALLALAQGAPLSPRHEERLAAIRARPEAAEVHVVQLTGAPKSLLRPGRAVALDLAPGRRIAAHGRHVAEGGATEVSFGGPVGSGEGWVDLVLSPRGVTALVQAGWDTYAVEPIGGRLHAAVRIDRRRIQPPHPEGTPQRTTREPAPGELLTGPTPAAPLGQVTASSSSTRLDVLVVYTPAAAAAYPNSMPDLIATGINQTNTAYGQSQVAAAVHLAGTAQVSYSETGRSYDQHLSALRNATHGLEGVPSLRNSTVADLVVLVVNDGSYCGMATGIGSTGATAFAVVSWNCIWSNTYVVAHELGHLQGADHDPANNCTVMGYPCGSYAYNHGYISPSWSWRTIMAYGSACNGCPPTNYFSNPHITHPWSGEAMGTTSQHWNANVLSNTAGTIRNFRTLAPPGTPTHSNLGVNYANPLITWNAVSGATSYNVERCITNAGASFSDSCFWPVINPHPSNAYYSDFQYQQTNGIHCPKIARYRVRTNSPHGLSGAGNFVGVCIY